MTPIRGLLQPADPGQQVEFYRLPHRAQLRAIELASRPAKGQTADDAWAHAIRAARGEMTIQSRRQWL